MSSTTGARRTGYEIKLSDAPRVGKGFWHACEDLGLEQAYVVAPVLQPYPLAENVTAVPPMALPTLAAGRV